MKKPFLITIIVFFILLLTWVTYKYTVNHTEDKINIITVNLSCNNGYKIIATYHTPDETGVLSKVSLKLKKENKETYYEMDSVTAASGAKFGTPDEKYFFWEHQGHFIFGEEDNTLTECSQKK